LKYLTVIFFSCLVNLSAQNFIFNNYSMSDGLPDDHVKCIIQDRNGFIWFGTQDGLTRFDGYEMKNYKNDPNNPQSLSNNGIWALHEGNSGIIWIGTQNGDLNKYNPRNNTFEHWSICNNKNAENYISCLFEDYKKNIWIGTYNKGLYKFNPKDNSIEHWQHNDNNANSLSNDFINAIVSDNEGNLWIGTYSGLNRFNPKRNKHLFKKYFADKTNPNSLTSNLIWNITKSSIDSDILYIATYRGLTIFNLKNKKFKKILLIKNPSNQFSNSIGSIIEKKKGNEIELWIGGYGGLIRYNISKDQTSQWHYDHKNPGSLINEQINDLLMDKSGVIWIATEGGVSSLSSKRFKFNNNKLQNFSEQDRSIIDESDIHSIVETRNTDIYIGTSQGLKNISRKNGNSKLKSVSQLKDVNIWCLAEGNSNNLWIGTYGKGLYNLDMASLRVNRFEFSSPTDRATPYNYVKSVYEDTKGIVWVGFWGGGLAILDPKTGIQRIFRKEVKSSSTISFNDVWKIYQDSFGRIWIGTNGGGLNLYENNNGDNFYRLSEGNTKIICNNVLSICEQRINNNHDNSTILWIGSTEGLIKLKVKNIKNYHDIKDIIINSEQYTTKNGLSNEVISQIIQDNSGDLWLATNNGLTKFNIREKKFVNFSTFDGLTGNDFSSGALLKSREGFIYAGNNKGLNIFNPDEIQLSGYHPQIIFTDFHIQHKQVQISNKSPLKENILFTKQITLNYNQNTFTLYFSSPDYNASQLIDYSYFMDGFDKEWSTPDHHNYAAYTNLDPGNYTLKVKATNSDEIWNKIPAEIRIIINPPWWKTTWAYAAYIFLIIAGLLAITKFQINRTELRNELKMREFEAKKHQELENLKSRFFANLSHEFRTPLMLVKGPIEQLINNYSKQGGNGQLEQLQMIRNNSQKLQNLIDQLLELSQLESASIPLKAKKENLILLIRGIVTSFEYMADQKNIKLILNSTKDIMTVWVDKDKLEKIINNLLSNAFKFTKENGIVSVNIDTDKTKAEAQIKISDTGIGIPEEKLGKIFDRFYQADDSSRKAYGGSGIGLALVKELIELHKWKISVRSEVDKGTEFTLSIPLEDSYLEESEKDYTESIGAENSLISQCIPVVSFTNEIQPANGGSKDNQKDSQKNISILIVEDSKDVRKYLSELLRSNSYSIKLDKHKIAEQTSMQLEIYEAENGEAGLQAAIEKMPDLIISDIMMPVMDGIEFCQKIKANWETSHIPVILLTAKASSESKIEGLETGADDYLTKPFDSKELFVRIKNLLEQRRKLREKFSKEVRINTESMTTNSIDNEFLNKALSIAEENISNSQFNSESFAEKMFVSKSQLNRKLQALTGRGPAEFVRFIRLKRAAQLLLERQFSVTQVAFEVGFNSPSHFTKAFQQQYSCLPSEFTSKV